MHGLGLNRHMGKPIENADEHRSAAVKERAAALGFDACGIAAATDADPCDRLGDWLRRGFHADMQWMETTRQIRQDVQRKLPGARSVVVVARNYFRAAPKEAENQDRQTARPDPEPRGKVARYAWGRDYHRVLRRPLQELARYIESLEQQVTTYASIDSGPVMERTWAERAGVGWVGKNSLILRKEGGSWFVLATVLTTLPLAPDAPVPDHCGTCALCMQACPTGAITEPKVVDANRCLSYLTIERRGAIASKHHEAMGNWVFGCDICQEVCPWNRRALLTDEADFAPRAGHAAPDLQELLRMSEDAFRQRFAGSALMRAKHAGLVRNSRIALDNWLKEQSSRRHSGG